MIIVDFIVIFIIFLFLSHRKTFLPAAFGLKARSAAAKVNDGKIIFISGAT